MENRILYAMMCGTVSLMWWSYTGYSFGFSLCLFFSLILVGILKTVK